VGKRLAGILLPQNENKSSGPEPSKRGKLDMLDMLGENFLSGPSKKT